MNGRHDDQPESPLDQTARIEHICHNCPLIRETREEINSLNLLQILSNAIGGETHEMLSSMVEAKFRAAGREDPAVAEEIRRSVGQMIANGMDSTDLEREEVLKHAEDLLEGCEGPISLSTKARGWFIGAIVCGSVSMTRDDSQNEVVHVTRLEAVDDEAE